MYQLFVIICAEHAVDPPSKWRKARPDLIQALMAMRSSR